MGSLSEYMNRRAWSENGVIAANDKTLKAQRVGNYYTKVTNTSAAGIAYTNIACNQKLIYGQLMAGA
jgi:hypothetical protein